MKSHELAAKLLELPNMDVAIPIENREKEYALVEDIAEYKGKRKTLVLRTGHFEEEDQLDMTGFIAEFQRSFS